MRTLINFAKMFIKEREFMPATEELIQEGFALHQEGKLEEAETAY